MSAEAPEVFLAAGDPVPTGRTRRCLSAVESREQLEEDGEEEEKEEASEKDNGVHAVSLRRAGAFRARNHSYDPFQRHSWGSGRELQDPLSRSEPRDPGCQGPQEASFLHSPEDLDPFLEGQHQSDQLPSLGAGSCHPPPDPYHQQPATLLSKSVSMSGINCFLDCSDTAGETRCGAG